MELKLKMHFFPGFKRLSRIQGVGQIWSLRLLPYKTLLGFMRGLQRHVLIASLVMICALSSLAIVASSQWGSTLIGSRGNIRIDGVGVYKDSNCSIVVSYLDWGTVEPGTIKNNTLFVRNEGNHVSTLFLAAGNWNPPEASNYMNLSWNYDSRMLNPMDSVEVTFSLSVSQAVQNITNFSFDVIIGINK